MIEKKNGREGKKEIKHKQMEIGSTENVTANEYAKKLHFSILI